MPAVLGLLLFVRPHIPLTHFSFVAIPSLTHLESWIVCKTMGIRELTSGLHKIPDLFLFYKFF